MQVSVHPLHIIHPLHVYVNVNSELSLISSIVFCKIANLWPRFHFCLMCLHALLYMSVTLLFTWQERLMSKHLQHDVRCYKWMLLKASTDVIQIHCHPLCRRYFHQCEAPAWFYPNVSVESILWWHGTFGIYTPFLSAVDIYVVKPE